MSARAVVVAFDGALADTMPLRRRALRDAMAEFSIAGPALDDPVIVEGESFAEAIRSRAADATSSDSTARDETLLDLCVLSADRRYLALAGEGVTFSPALIASLQAMATIGTRLVLRADSPRRLVERALRANGIDELFSSSRCGDDATVAPAPSALAPSALARAWVAIDARLRALGIGPDARLAIEPAAAHAVAQRHCAAVELPDR